MQIKISRGMGQAGCSPTYSPGNCDSVGGTYDNDNEVCICPANPTPLLGTQVSIPTMVGQGVAVVGQAAGSVVGSVVSGVASGVANSTGVPAVVWYAGLGLLAFMLIKK